MQKNTLSAAEERAFHEALALWDRPESELYGRVLEANTDTDAFIEHALDTHARAG